MRIVYLHQYFNTPSMAGSTRSYSMARYLVAAGHDVQMVTTWRESTPSKTWFESTEAGINVHWLPLPYSNHMTYTQRVKAFLRFAWASARKAEALDGDVIIASSTPLTIAIPAIYASLRCKAPLVFEVRDMWPDVPIALGVLRNPVIIAAAKMLERLAYTKATHIVVLAPGMKEDIENKGVPAGKMSVIPNGCDRELAAEFVDSTEPREFFDSISARKVILYAGTIGRANGCDYLIALACELKKRERGIRIVVIGDGAEKADLITRAASEGVLSKNLFFLDPMPKARLAGWLKEADMHIALMRGPQSYLKDAVNNKFFDAVAVGRPVASNFEGFQSKVAIEAGIGLILDAEDFERATADIERALDDESWLAAVPGRAKVLAEGQFSRNKLAAALERVLLTVVRPPT